MKKKIFILMVIIQLGVFLGLVYEKNTVLKKGKEYTFEVSYYDPYDFMRGNYLRLSLSERELQRSGEEEYRDERGYFILEERGGIAHITSFQKRRPKKGDYIRGRISYTYEDKHYIDNPFKRYYVEESVAAQMEERLRKAERAYLKVRVYKGKYVIDSIEIK